MTKTTFESFIINDGDGISLYTMTLYTRQQCGEPQLDEINRFLVSNSKWTTKKFFLPIIENFFGCPVLLGFMSDFRSIIEMPYLNDVRNPVEGILVDYVRILASDLNFDINYRPYYGTDFELNIGLRIYHKRCFNLGNSLSDAIYSSSAVIAVPPGETFTSWEKLYLPFDRATWIWLGITFATAFVVIFLIKRSESSSMYSFVI